MPEPRSELVKITAFVNASHASDKNENIAYRICNICKQVPNYIYSKRQLAVESSTFSSEFIIMKTCTEHIIALRSKLRMFQVHIDGPAIMLNDNERAVNNIPNIKSTLKKKHIPIAYHLVNLNVAAGVVKIGWILT